MPPKSYYYKAVSAGGEITTGSLTARDEKEVVFTLQKQQLVPLQISFQESAAAGAKPAGTGRGEEASAGTLPGRFGPGSFGLPRQKSEKKGLFSGLNKELTFWKRTNRKDLIHFAENLAVILSAGIALNRGLTIVSQLTEKKHFQGIILEVQQHLKEGSTFWEALQTRQSVFPPIFINMVRAGESSGVLDSILNKLADYLKSVDELREFFVAALIYPVILTLTSALSIAVLLLFVLPKFNTIFIDMGIPLPLSTKILLSLGDFLQSYYWALIGSVLALVFAFRYYLKTAAGRKQWDRFKLRIPLLGSIIKKIEIARFSRTLGTLLASGVSILASVSIVQGVILNRVLTGSLSQVYEDLKQGKTLSRALEDRQVFSGLAVQMVGVGEETGHMDTMLEKVAEIYETETKGSIKKLTSLFEPVIILVMGCVIGLMVISIFMAIFSVNTLAV
ncbi:MAG: type II secretion system F family protein [Desulfohalobiaceae bacterium]|nr:type II secretion system F family protein [Desulfohalobiaceae bacterium]